MNEDTLYCIFCYLEIHDIIKCSRINKLFNKSAKREVIWKPLFEKKYPKLLESTNKNYHKNYADYSILSKFLLDDHEDISDILKKKKYRLCPLGSKILPEQIGLLTNLGTLIISYNRFRELPNGMSKLVNLTELYADNNELQCISDSVFSLTNLTALRLNYNNLKLISPKIGQLTNLQSLSFCNNKIESLPKEIGLLQQLNYLDLNENNLKYIPNEICLLTNLDNLYLCCNHLHEIPNLKSMKKLRQVWLYSNSINDFRSSTKFPLNCICFK